MGTVRRMFVNITLSCSASEEYWNLMSLTENNRKEYCDRWQINLRLHKYSPDIPMNKWRQTTQLEHLKSCDWLWFMGVDTCITNMTVDVRQLISSFGQCDVIASDDTWGLNNDVMFIRNCYQSEVFLNQVRAMTDKMTDQDAMVTMFRRQKRLTVRRVCHKLFNAYPHRKEYHDPGYWDVGDFIAHYPGLSNELRMELIPQQLNQVVR